MRTVKITLTASLLIALVSCRATTPPSTQETSIPTLSPSANGTLPPVANSSPRESSISTTPSASPNTPLAITPSPTESPAAATSKAETSGQSKLISAGGIGPAKVGMTLGQLKQMLAGKAQFQVKSPYIVDFDAIAVIQSGKAQFYILYPAGTPLKDSDAIEALVTDNPSYRTAEGIGPGTPIQQAEAVYGDATLTYSTLNESREYVKFAKQPSEDISFRLGAINDGSFAGIYPSASGELNQTKTFKKTAAIGLVEVYCGRNCPPPSPPSL